ncbi:MAG: V-type ATP synthase subunit I [Halothiobacillaceae bacterium]
MSIVKLGKVTLIGPLAEKDRVLEDLQALGVVHLVPLRRGTGPAGGSEIASDRPESAYRALRWLLDTPDRRLQVRDERDFDFDAIIETVEHNRRALNETRAHLEELQAQRKRLEPWGNFSPPAPGEFGAVDFWFYVLTHRQFQQLPKDDLNWSVVRKDSHNVYLVIMGEREPPEGRMPVPPTPLGHLSLTRLDHLIERSRARIEELEFERLSLTRWITLISRQLARAEDLAALQHAGHITRDDEGLFVLHGWMPRHERDRVERFADAHRIAAFFESPAPTDRPPTLLKNPPAVAGGEDLAGFFQTPGYADWDPSRILFFSFALFFAMIMADAGYALVLAAGLTVFWRRLGHGRTGRRLRNLAATTFAAATVYGVLVGSYFGVSPPEDTLLAQLQVLDLNDFDSMLRLSVFIGVAHLMMANGFRAARYWPDRVAGAAIAWNGVLLAGFVGWLSASGVLPTWLISICWVLGIGSGLTILALGSRRPVHGVRDALLRLFESLNALTRITKAFGDVLSYMRLFALGLASASLALTFNQIAGDVAEALPGMGLFLAALVLIFGHVLNLALAILSGVVHGLRLNFIEFYNWGLSDEGYPFRPFRKKEIHHE